MNRSETEDCEIEWIEIINKKMWNNIFSFEALFSNSKVCEFR